ncbi:MAG: HpcH/HpaI aldolase/citrate lyase family protein, partial [Alphaproteobacteria bacterium]
RTTGIGAPSPDYGILTSPDDGLDGARAFHWGDMWHYPLSRIVAAARANGLRPLDGPYADFKDADGLAAQARRAAALGCEGKWAIHPGQVDAINAIFSPGADEIAEARAILAAMRRAADSGQGAAVLDGRMIDVASVRQAEVLVKKAELIEAAG